MITIRNLGGFIIRTVDSRTLEGADLRGADLRSADLPGADLRGTDLSGVSLRRADLYGADLARANLTGANLARANLGRANLTGANLARANLTGANLYSANLTGANLTRTNLNSANLTGANLTGANISSFVEDILAVLRTSPNEVPYLREKIIVGEINGTAYEGDCACLVGTLANAQGVEYGYCHAAVGRELGTHNPSEQWFWQIKIGDTPENNYFSKIALECCDNFLKQLEGGER